MPIYEVDNGHDIVRLVKANTPQSARSHCAKREFHVEIPTPERVHVLATKGIKIEDATRSDAGEDGELPFGKLGSGG